VLFVWIGIDVLLCASAAMTEYCITYLICSDQVLHPHFFLLFHHL